MSPTEKATAYDDLQKCLGYVENGSDTTVKISQDDATKDWVVSVGKAGRYGDTNLSTALALAAAENDPF